MINWDTSAGLPPRPEVLAAMVEVLRSAGANPSSVHAAGRAARAVLDGARHEVARLLGAASPREIIFTGSGSEAAALAVLGAFRARADVARRRVVVSAIEHPCVLKAAAVLEQEGAEVVRVPVDASGVASLGAFAAAIDGTTALVSLMVVNNETGVIQPVAEVARLARDRGAVMHADAAQAMGKVEVPVGAVELLSFSAHKLGGPAGAGVLFNRRHVPVAALTPGHQEDGRRGGTPSAAMARGTAVALRLALGEQAAAAAALAPVRELFEHELLQRWPVATIQGRAAPRVAGTSSVTLPGLDAERLLIALDLEGICVSTGAACASGSLSPSHVLLAMGLSPADARSTLRLSLPADATPEQARHVIASLERAVARAR